MAQILALIISDSVSALVVANAAQSLLWKDFLALSAADFSTQASSLREDLRDLKSLLEQITNGRQNHLT